MSKMELALLVLLAVIICVMVFRDVKVKGQLEDMQLSIDLHQNHLAELGRVDDAQQDQLNTHLSWLKRLDEQTAKSAARFQQQLNGLPNFAALKASVERLQLANLKKRPDTAPAFYHVPLRDPIELQSGEYISAIVVHNDKEPWAEVYRVADEGSSSTRQTSR